MKVWFEDPKQLVSNKKILEFWPNSKQTPEDRINSASRFIIYTMCVLFVIRRDPRIFVLGATMLSIIYVMYKAKLIKEPYDSTEKYSVCQKPTKDNPMGNVLMTDYTDAPNRLEACYYATAQPSIKKFSSETVNYDMGRSRSALPTHKRNAFERQFVTAPVSKIPGDQTAFAEWLYGSKNRPMCKTDTKLCNPDARGVQLEAFAGIGSDGDVRGLRGGGRVRGGGGTYS
jgi:hypothetical protein